MPASLERKLKKEYPHNDHAVYGTLNKLGYMKGNKETAKGRALDRAKKGKKHRAHGIDRYEIESEK